MRGSHNFVRGNHNLMRGSQKFMRGNDNVVRGNDLLGRVSCALMIKSANPKKLSPRERGESRVAGRGAIRGRAKPLIDPLPPSGYSPCSQGESRVIAVLPLGSRILPARLYSIAKHNGL